MTTTVKDIFQDAKKYFPKNPLGELVFFEKYSRWSDALGRREVWPETVQRAMDYVRELSENSLPEEIYQRLHDGILTMKILPSMRLMAMAGKAARRSHITLYNCAYMPIDSLVAFKEALIISMSGTGLGYSVEQKYVKQLQRVLPQRGIQLPTYVVPDSAEGWSEALERGLVAWFNGYDISFDFSRLRPTGAVLHTKGGRSSGPKPLRDMLSFARARIIGRQGKRLSSLDCHDMLGNIALGAVSGGHRRSAMIALYTWDDQEMRHCKDGAFWEHSPWRTTANNSAVLDDGNVGDDDLRLHFQAMVAGGNGEPGIFSRDSTRSLRPTRRQDAEFGTNPCGEIGLRPQEFCNLTEVILRPEDTRTTIFKKVELATILGTIQSLAINFPGLRPQWQENCEEERLLGVGFTGQMDCPVFQNPYIMQLCRDEARYVNEVYANELGINRSVSITCVKPSGSTSLLTGASSGLHTRWAPFSERNVRLMASGPVAKAYLASMGPADPENGQTWEQHDTIVAHFPTRAPTGSLTRLDRSALDQLEYWKLCKLNLTEHNPSVTIMYRPEEVPIVEDWIVENRPILGGQAYLPLWEDDLAMPQMPNIQLTEKEYHQRLTEFPEIDYSLVTVFETEDLTTSAMEAACSSGLCDA